ncbi:pumilio homolog 3 [Ischnura elegans]|uniref:pumilio homolog 3 n=1 Tax=Ischnura elegans TaxID=197161 RepID=UPI001ED8BAFC|nr:pumilio homolog 3 [Ischnura elegans]XP_046406191.1 pumilio homolog 3 [Ischnura elegans]
MGKRKAEESTQYDVIEKEEVSEKKGKHKDGIKKKKFSDSRKQEAASQDDPEETSPQHGIKRKTFEKTGNKPSIAKKPDWGKLKEKKKVLKVERKKKKSMFELGVKAKQLWEQLRRKNCSKEKSMELVKELHSLLVGNYAKAVFSHDVGRVVQWLLKMGTQQIHEEIAMELKGHLVEMAQSKYGSFCVKQLLKRGSKEIKNAVITSCLGNVVKLMSHRISSPLLSSIYSTYANSLQKCHLRQEFYCDIYRVMKNDEVKSLKLALEVSKEMKEAILGTTKGNLLKVINKELVESQLVNTVLGEYISLCSEADRSEIISTISSFLPLLTQTKEGAKVGMMCLWHGTQKDRKVVVKSLKGSVSQVALCEHGYLVLLSLFDCVDDTVLVKKALISELLGNILEIAKHKSGRHVFLYLVAPRDPSYFHPHVVEMLKLGDNNAHSKKATDVRRAELLNAVSEPLLESIAKNVEEWFSDNSVGMVALAVLKAGKGAKLKDAFEALALHLCKESEDDEESTNPLEDPGLHLILKKLILYDKTRHEENSEEVLFGEIFLSTLDEDSLARVISSNRGCFILVKLLEIDIPNISKMLKKKLKGNLSDELAKLESKGGEVLRDKLKG